MMALSTGRCSFKVSPQISEQLSDSSLMVTGSEKFTCAKSS
jgi:hypothetical protein